jgi:hypothetical protein
VKDAIIRVTVDAESIREQLAKAWSLGMWTMYNTTSSEWPPIPEQNPFRQEGAE